MSGRSRSFVIIALLLFVQQLYSQRSAPGKAFSDYIDSNEQFGTKYLLQVPQFAPDRNLAVAPISISMSFAALRDSIFINRSLEELQEVFCWKGQQDLAWPNQMLMAHFHGRPEKRAPATLKGKAKWPTMVLNYSPDEMWVTNEFLHRKGVVPTQRFVDEARDFFGVSFREIGEAREKAAVTPTKKGSMPLPSVTAKSDFSIVSEAHLRTSWRSTRSP